MSNEGLNYSDSHCHLADLRMNGVVDEVLNQSKSLGIRLFLQGGYSPDDWSRQVDLSKRHLEIVPVFGVHPMWIAKHSASEVEQALDQLARMVGSVAAIGETGLDLRPQFKESIEVQYESFQAQVELAELVKKPLVLHIVKAHFEVTRCFDIWGWPTVSAMVHAYNGDWETAKKYLDRGFYLSIGGALTFSRNLNLRKAILDIPEDKILIESDSPDQSPFQWTESVNKPSSIFNVARSLADLRGQSPEYWLQVSAHNLSQFLGL